MGEHERVIATHGSITIVERGGGLEITDGTGTSVTFGPAGVHVRASATVTIDASAVEINAGVVRVNSGSASFSGVVQAQTVVAESVVAQSYTPGAGNVW